MTSALTDAEYRHLLQRCEREIAAQTNLPLLLPMLRAKKLLVDEEFRALQELPSYERGSHLVQILQKKGGEDAFSRFMAALKQEEEHLGHKNLAGRLLKEKEEIISKRPPIPRRRTSGPGFRTPPVARKVPLIPQTNNKSKSLDQIDEVGLEKDVVSGMHSFLKASSYSRKYYITLNWNNAVAWLVSKTILVCMSAS